MTATRAPVFLRLLFAALAVAFVIDSPCHAQFTPAEPPPMAPAEFAPDYVDQTWKWSILTDTIPGYLYSVEESSDLATWTLLPNSYFYGNGTQMKCFICNGPPPPSQNTNGNGSSSATNSWPWQVHHFSLTLRMKAGVTASSYFLQRESSDSAGPNAWQTNLNEPLPPQVEGNRYFSMLEWADPTTHLLYWVDVHVFISEDTPPTADFAHPPLEADLTIYQNIKPQLIARLLTPVSTAPSSNTPSNSKFARIRRTAIDSNGNGYPDWYEYVNHGPDSVFATEDSPDYVDGSLDSDGDGFTNAEEIAAGTDPNSATSHPPETTYLAVATKSISFGGVIFGSMWGLPSSLRHTITKENSWQPPFTKTTLGAGYSSATAMEVDLLGPAFPASPDKMPLKTEAELAAVTGIKLVGGYLQSAPSPLAASGSAAKARYWLVHKPKSPETVTRTFVIKTTKSNLTNQANPEITYAVKTLTVAENQTISSPTSPDELEARPSTIPPAPGDTTATVSIIRELLPIEVKQPKITLVYKAEDPVPVNEVRLCRWNSEHDPSLGRLVDPQDFPKADPDRIIISIPLPHKAGQGPLQIHVSTDGAKDTPMGAGFDYLYNDAGADIELVEKVPGEGVFESKPIAIVADQEDDMWNGGRVAVDGELNDPTFIGWPGGKLKIKIPDLDNKVVDFPIKKFSHSFTYAKIIAGDIVIAGDPIGNTNTGTAIAQNLIRLKEIYAPLHERVDRATPQKLDRHLS